MHYETEEILNSFNTKPGFISRLFGMVGLSTKSAVRKLESESFNLGRAEGRSEENSKIWSEIVNRGGKAIVLAELDKPSDAKIIKFAKDVD